MRPEIVFIDKPDVDEALAERLKKCMRARLVIFSNLTGAGMHADIVVTADMLTVSGLGNMRFRDEKTGTIYFYGPKYWILRKATNSKGRQNRSCTMWAGLRSFSAAVIHRI